MPSGPRQVHYAHSAPGSGGDWAETPFQVALGETRVPNCPDAMRHALFTMRLAVELGIKPPAAPAPHPRPYSDDADTLLFGAPLISLVCGQRVKLLRGWKQFGGCVKGFNALGLLAEHAWVELEGLKRLPPDAQRRGRIDFLRSRRRDGKSVFTEQELAAYRETDLASVDLLAVSLWRSFARRMIVCSTSSNLGISLHQALRLMQSKRLEAGGKTFGMLNADEGELLIWVPDEAADFMNPQKTAALRALEAERPKLTTLRTYINRRQRDPGALKDALNAGGYFFPTNPQSPEEMQNLLAMSLAGAARERSAAFEEVLLDPNVRQTLAGLGAAIVGDRVEVRCGVEGGLYGLAVPYLIMLEESLLSGDTTAVSTWSQTSIGAALAAGVLCDSRLSGGPEAATDIQAELSRFFPRLMSFLKRSRLGRDLRTRIHGVFDTANLQSLAQLFGVAATRHLSGRGTAFVGLGSSSYANGNLCFDLLRASAESSGAFPGPGGLHPATHAVNPLAQALIYAEDLARAASAPQFSGLAESERIAFVRRHAVKPEPAGAAAAAGYLLARLDGGTLSFFEIAYALRLAGFTRETFLEFGDYGRDELAESRFVQEAIEEGEYMESLARSLMRSLALDLAALEGRAREERARSRLAYRWNSLHDDAFERRAPVINICLTGDNCGQPSADLVGRLLVGLEANRDRLRRALEGDAAARSRQPGFDAVWAAKTAAGILCGALSRAHRGIRRLMRGAIEPAINRMMVERNSHPPREKS